MLKKKEMWLDMHPYYVLYSKGIAREIYEPDFGNQNYEI